MASSSSYWAFAENVREELKEISAEAEDLYGLMESNDDPGELAEGLGDLKKRVDKVSEQLEPAIPALKKTSAALETIPPLKRS